MVPEYAQNQLVLLTALFIGLLKSPLEDNAQLPSEKVKEPRFM
jgi:hypothetical protein